MNKKTALIIAIIMILSQMTTFVSASGDDKITNIALNMPYTIEYGASVEYSYKNYTENGQKYDIDDGVCLTDGVYAPVKDTRDGYYRAFRGYSRLIGFDFGKEMRITGFKADFLHYNAGIYAPTFLNIYLSADGENYVKCGSVDTLPIYSSTAKKRKYSFDFGVPYRARYVKVEFASDVFVYCDEIEIYGSGDISGCLEVPPYEETPDKGIYPKFSDKVKGAGSIIKIYDGYYQDQSKADNTKEELLPYIAYIDKQGNITDTMFDSVAFVPCHTDYPSGGRLVLTSGKPGAVKSDWELYFTNTFKENFNINALEEAAGEVNSALGINNKIKVFLTIPYPALQDKPFGDINGDGREEYTRTLAERVEVIKWYIDRVVDLYNKQNFQNLELAGFYWYKESVSQEISDHEDRLVLETKMYINENHYGLCLLFDPYYLSSGFDKWEEYGFDGAVMQPNLVFRDYCTTEMLGEFAEQIKKFGLGVEIETGEPGNFNTAEDIKKYGEIYENYLYYGAKYGYINALQTFYQGAGPGTIYRFYSSSDPYMNYLYDITHKFIKGIYSIDPPVINAENQKFEINSERNRIYLDIATDCYIQTLTVNATSEHSKVTLLPSKDVLLYTPEKDFEGIDEITLTVTDKYNQTSTRTITVTVENPGGESSEGTEKSTEETQDESKTEKPKKSSNLFIFLAMGGIICVTGLVIGLMFSKKKRK